MRFDGCSIVACGTLRRELGYLRESGFLNAERLLYTGAGLHARPEELERQLVRQLGRARESSPNVIVVYGSKCYLDPNEPSRTIDSIVDGTGVCRVQAQGCIDMLCDAKCQRDLSNDESVLWLSPGWIENWRRIWQEYLGWDAADANMNFPGFYRRAVFLDPQPLGVFDEWAARSPEKILEFSDWTRLPVESRPVTLERLGSLLVQCRTESRNASSR
ncbi:MAG: DUF1638 domain-containing protein [Armatimonadota bacterium]|nr:MAG: DUF1638 domain-containing protein [Armatimonadota bacterium]